MDSVENQPKKHIRRKKSVDEAEMSPEYASGVLTARADGESARPRRLSFMRALGTAVLVLALASGSYWYGAHTSRSISQIVFSGLDENPERRFADAEQPLFQQPDFFKEVKEKFIENKTTFLEANLSDMKMRFYREGVLEKEVSILTKGKEGSWWETPAGLYEVQSKSEQHFSSFGHVYTPWNMVFQGNFFIHGWPTYPDGRAVESTYSGGCIRLSDADARALYDLAPVHTPVLVYEEDYGSDGFMYSVNTVNVSAKQYAVLDIGNGTVLAQKGMDEVRPIASVTKIITALVAAEHINLDKDIVIDPGSLASTSVPRLKAGDAISAYSLLLPLLLESSNEAAEVLARNVGRDRFIGLMNDKVKALGMKDTELTDPAGAEHTNVSTVADLLRLAQYLYNNRSFILKISSGREVPTLYKVTTFDNLQNFNEVPGIDGFVGGKVGKNSIGESAVLLFKVKIDGNERVLAVVLLDSSDRNADTRALISHVQRTYNGAMPEQ
ncbi:L,D-transpeptidase family protein [Candidatus Kaiserbacteria bacterium]|nr:L,D-transpeptidase family protein [Candidatus Kaiserbacteria bacterium]